MSVRLIATRRLQLDGLDNHFTLSLETLQLGICFVYGSHLFNPLTIIKVEEHKNALDTKLQLDLSHSQMGVTNGFIPYGIVICSIRISCHDLIRSIQCDLYCLEASREWRIDLYNVRGKVTICHTSMIK